MVGCAAGTIKNVWCRISDRHRRFGHNAPLSAAGTSSAYARQLRRSKAPPRSFFFPSAGLTECKARLFWLCDKDGTVRPCRRGHGLSDL
jgi:hypothetical protein